MISLVNRDRPGTIPTVEDNNTTALGEMLVEMLEKMCQNLKSRLDLRLQPRRDNIYMYMCTSTKSNWQAFIYKAQMNISFTFTHFLYFFFHFGTQTGIYSYLLYSNKGNKCFIY